MRRSFLVLTLGMGIAAATTGPAPAQEAGQPPATLPAPLNRFFYYPYYYFPANYWPTQGPKWPEPVGAPYMRPPAYMAYPPFNEQNWRYEYNKPKRYYRGFALLARPVLTLARSARFAHQYRPPV